MSGANEISMIGGLGGQQYHNMNNDTTANSSTVIRPYSAYAHMGTGIDASNKNMSFSNLNYAPDITEHSREFLKAKAYD